MATQFLGIDLGENYDDVVRQTSTNSTNLELTYDDTVYDTVEKRLQLRKDLQQIIVFLSQEDFPS